MIRFHRLLPYVALATLAVAGVLLVGLPSAAARSGGVARSVRVEASTFAFTPATIEVDPGDRVTIELASADVVHGLHIEGYDVNLIADPGQPASASFVVDRPGTFRIRCSVPCGPLHPFMAGRLQVGPPLTFYAAVVLAALALGFGGIGLRRPGAGAGIRGSPA
jgi:heme/copper-type cytochrome/quinol oxidase subunit 2